MKNYDPFRCFLIGEGSLPLQCGNVLLKRQHEICGVISPDAALRQWAEQHHLPHYAPTDDLLHILGTQPFDYLFSIVNSAVIPANALKFPRQYAINYHNAPLPKYAGTNVASYAIMRQEKFHGATWHVMTDIVDAGDILKQQIFPIEAHETALSLNTKCYETALNLFSELVDELACGRVQPVQQNLTERTYIGRYQRPPAACLLDWTREAEVIDALVRGLTFGNYPNPLGLPKFLVGHTCLAVAALELSDRLSQSPPGTITAITPETFSVATATVDVNVRQIAKLDGKLLSVTECAAQFDLHERDVLPLPSVDLAQRLTDVHAQICRSEPFWIKRLETLQPMPLPSGAHRMNPTETDHTGCITINLPAPVDSDVLLAACMMYLARFNNLYEGDLAFCSPELRQVIEGIESFFALYVPFHLHLDDTQSLRANQRVIQEEIARVNAHTTYMRDMVARFPALRSKTELRDQVLLPVAIEIFEGGNPLSAWSDAYLTLRITGNGGVCHWIYKTDWLKPDDAARLVHYFKTFASALLAQPEQPLASVPLLTQDEQQQILYEWNATQVEYPYTSCLHQIFEAQVRKTPEAIAVVYEDTQLTYRELNWRANQLAHYLRKSGVGPEALVGLCMERSVEILVGLLGILKAGGAYVPVEPIYPRERLASIIKDAGISLFVTQQHLSNLIPGKREQKVCIDTDWGVIAQENQENLKNQTTPENLVYVLFTSGSTGKPKGVGIEHRQLMNYLHGILERIQFKPGANFAMVSTFAADLGNTMLFPALCTGGSLHIISQERSVAPDAFANYMHQHRIDCVKIVPSHLDTLLRSSSIAEQTLPRQRLILGGETLHWSLMEKLQAFVSDECFIFNHYGPTETTVGVVTYQWKQKQAVEHQNYARTCPLGRPLVNTQIYILDSNLQPVPIGVSGEVYIGGNGVGRGYLNRPDATAEKFLPHPFTQQSGARLYKTGDLARYLPDGNIEFLGRSDHQVKIRGFRIEPGEIETLLSKNPVVQDAVVLVREDIPGDKRLVAYVIPAQGEHPAYRELRNALTEKLPEYMIPAAFITLKSFPLTPNGKLDRHAFPRPDWSQRQGKHGIVAPRTSTERILVEIWADVLELELVSIDDNFFEIGGHSLSGMRILSRLQDLLNISLPLHTLFESPTVERLARAIEMLQWAVQNRQPLTSIDEGEREVFVI